MPKGVPFAEGLSALEYERLKRDRPYVTQLYNRSSSIVNYTPLLNRLKQKGVEITAEEGVFIKGVINNLRRDQYVSTSIKNRKQMPVPYDAYTGAKPAEITLGYVFPRSVPENIYYAENFQDYGHYDTHGRLDGGKSHTPSAIDLFKNPYNTPSGMYWTAGPNVFLGKLTEHISKVEQWLKDINNNVSGINTYQDQLKREAAARAEAARQEELRKKAQEAAAKASYEDALRFKTEEFNRALAAQKEEHGRRSQEYEARLAQFSANFERQTKELSGVRLELAKQKTDYENQIAARKLEESKRKQEAEVLQSNLKRRIAIYEAGRGANLHFVGINGGDGQSKGARVFANSGGRYVKSRVSYNPGGAMRFNNSSEDSSVPDLFLEVFSSPNATTRNKKGRK